MNNQEFISTSIKTIFEMLKDRKIDISSISDDDISEWIKNNFNKSYFSIVINKIKIVYYTPANFKWPDLRTFLLEDKKKYSLMLLIVREKISQNHLKSILLFMKELNIPIQIFDIKELQFNITNHILVPKHELINEDEAKSIIEKYSLKTKYQLPHILKTDPMSKYLGLKSGDIIKITRNSNTAGEYISFRCCL
jgi:DNA-directed RNA polymerase I, II, and III subunit RPABC1